MYIVIPELAATADFVLLLNLLSAIARLPWIFVQLEPINNYRRGREREAVESIAAFCLSGVVGGRDGSPRRA